MIADDYIYKKHQHCSATIKLFKSDRAYNNNQFRVYCVDHDKWLHTLTDEEALNLAENNPDLFD